MEENDKKMKEAERKLVSCLLLTCWRSCDSALFTPQFEGEKIVGNGDDETNGFSREAPVCFLKFCATCSSWLINFLGRPGMSP